MERALAKRESRVSRGVVARQLLQGALSFLIHGVMTGLAGAIVMFMVLVITADVIARYLLRSPLPGVLELTESTLMVFIVFLALSSAKHIRVSLVVARLPGTIRLVVQTLIQVVSIGLLTLAGVESFRRAMFSLAAREATTGLIPFPVYPARFVVSIGLFALAIELLLRIGPEKESGRDQE